MTGFIFKIAMLTRIHFKVKEEWHMFTYHKYKYFQEFTKKRNSFIITNKGFSWGQTQLPPGSMLQWHTKLPHCSGTLRLKTSLSTGTKTTEHSFIIMPGMSSCPKDAAHFRCLMAFKMSTSEVEDSDRDYHYIQNQ